MQPIILIGAGRSGSTLLMKMFNAHPAINFYGETDFLVPRLWNQLWDNRFWFHWDLHSHSHPFSAISRCNQGSFVNLRHEIDLNLDPEIVKYGRMKTAQAIRHAMETLFPINKENASAWGFKELWNGSNSFKYDWKPYDDVYPDAIWIHLIRNPFAFAQSSSQWNKSPLTFDTLKYMLADWVRIIEYSRQRQITERFYEMQFEQVLNAPEQHLKVVFDACDLKWNSACKEQLHTRVMQSQPEIFLQENADLTPELISQLCDEIAEFKNICNELGYALNVTIPNYFRSYSTIVKPSVWIIPEPNLAIITPQFQLQATQNELQATQNELQATQNELQATQNELQATQNELQAVKVKLAHDFVRLALNIVSSRWYQSSRFMRFVRRCRERLQRGGA